MSANHLTHDEPLPPELGLQVNVVCDRFESAWRQGRPPRLEDYLSDFPEPGRPALLRELILLDIEYQRRQGETPTPQEYQQRFPDAPLGWLARELKAAPLAQAGRYRLEGELARGGMGVVYRAFDPDCQRSLAVKVLQEWHQGRADLERRFLEEAQLTSQLQHPGITPVHEIGRLPDGRPFFAMKLVQGRTLAALLQERTSPACDLPGFVGIFAQVCQTVAYAHARGVIHRDLKPANVMVGAFGEVQVMDWGLAKVLAPAGAGPQPPEAGASGSIATVRTLAPGQSSQVGAVLGTPAYMAPEQARGEVDLLDRRCDVFGLGAILCVLLTGEPPYRGASRGAQFRQASRADLADASARLEACGADGELVRLARACLAAEAGQRPADAGAVAEVVAAYQAAVQERLRRAELERAAAEVRAREEGKRRRLAVALALASGVAVLALVVGTVVSAAFGVLQADTAGRLRVALGESEDKGQQLQQTNHQLAKTNRKATDLALGLGLHLCEQGEVPLGILWLAHSLETAPPEADDLQRAIRTNLAGWGALLRPLRASLPAPSEILALAYSPNGQLFVTATEDGTAQLWDTATGKPLGRPLKHRDKIPAVAFSPDGTTVLTGSWDGTACLWDVATGKVIPLLHSIPVWAVAFSPDGTKVLTGGAELLSPPGASRDRPPGGEARLWEAATGRLVHTLPHDEQVYAAAFSPDGTTVLTGSADRKARIWEAATGRLLHRLPHEGPVRVVAFSHDSRTALTGNLDRTARLWDVATGRPLVTLPHTGEVLAVAFSPDDKTILTGGIQRDAQLWKADTGEALGFSLPHHGPVLAVAFSPDGRAILTGSSDRTARLWDAATGEPLGPALLNPGTVEAVAFSPDGTTVLTGSKDLHTRKGEARLWDLAARYVATPLRPPGTVSAMALSPDGKLAVTGHEDGTAQLWDTATGKPLRLPLEHRGKIPAVAVSPGGTTVLIASADGTALLWEVASGQPLGPARRYGKAVHALAFSPDGRMVLTGAGKEARLWDAATGSPLGEPLGHPRIVWAVAFSSDGKAVLTGCGNGEAQLWDVATGKPLGPPLHQGKGGSTPARTSVLAVALSPDGKTALTRSSDGVVRFWEVATGKPIGPPLAHPGRVCAVAFSPDGKTARTGTEKEVRRWEVPAPVDGDVRRIVLWSQTVTGTELDPGGAVQVLDSPTWQERRRRLEELGGPPRP
jgi:WD40 repeat protein